MTHAERRAAKDAARAALAGLIYRVPPPVANGSVQIVRQWLHTQHAAALAFKSERASLRELDDAVTRMRGYSEPAPAADAQA